MSEATLPLLFWIGGGFVILVSLIIIFMNRSVSTGHSLMFATGAALVCFPYLASFEWTDKSLKFTTKQQTAELVRNVANSAKDEVQLRNQINDLTKALKAVTDRISVIEASGAQGSPAGPGNPPQADVWPDAKLDDLIMENNSALQGAQQRLDNFGKLEMQLLQPSM